MDMRDSGLWFSVVSVSVVSCAEFKAHPGCWHTGMVFLHLLSSVNCYWQCSCSASGKSSTADSPWNEATERGCRHPGVTWSPVSRSVSIITGKKNTGRLHRRTNYELGHNLLLVVLKMWETQKKNDNVTSQKVSRLMPSASNNSSAEGATGCWTKLQQADKSRVKQTDDILLEICTKLELMTWYVSRWCFRSISGLIRTSWCDHMICVRGWRSVWTSCLREPGVCLQVLFSSVHPERQQHTHLSLLFSNLVCTISCFLVFVFVVCCVCFLFFTPLKHFGTTFSKVLYKLTLLSLSYLLYE